MTDLQPGRQTPLHISVWLSLYSTFRTLFKQFYPFKSSCSFTNEVIMFHHSLDHLWLSFFCLGSDIVPTKQTSFSLWIQELSLLCSHHYRHHGWTKQLDVINPAIIWVSSSLVDIIGRIRFDDIWYILFRSQCSITRTVGDIDQDIFLSHKR